MPCVAPRGLVQHMTEQEWTSARPGPIRLPACLPLTMPLYRRRCTAAAYMMYTSAPEWDPAYMGGWVRG